MVSPAPLFPDAPPTPSCPNAPAAPPCSLDASPTLGAQATLPDHLTEEILLRVPTAADLARASMADPSLRRIIADHSFLRCFSTLLSICLAEYLTHMLLFVFSSSGPHAGQWHTVTFDGWSALIAGVSEGDDDAQSSTAFRKRYYVHGCFCWAIPGIDRLLMLNTGTMEFSFLNLVPSPWSNCQTAFVEAREGGLGLFALAFSREHYAYHLWYAILVSTGDGTKQSLWEDVVTLPHDYFSYILGVAGGYLLLHGSHDDDLNSFPLFEMPEPNCFSLNLQTMKVERLCGSELMMPLQGQLYAGFPPSLSPPTI